MTTDSWLEVSFIIDGERAEAVAEVLARFVEGGVVIESTQVAVGEKDQDGQAVGPLRVCGYLPADAGLADKRRRLEEALWYLGRIRPLPEAQFKTIARQDWSEAWKQHYRPVAIGRRLLVVPAWLDSPDPSRVAVRIDPGMAFGTGTHPTTQLCLQLLDELVDPAGTDRLIDVGCGSGILAIAALLLGAGCALGVDTDPQAVAAAHQNAAANQVTDRLEVSLGSIQEILAGQFSIRRAPLVVANILAPVLIRLLGEGLGELLEPGGQLLLSGILDVQTQGVIEAARLAGFRLERHIQEGDWVALTVSGQQTAPLRR
jgi:ribosomal protein L11 methyltransferase